MCSPPRCVISAVGAAGALASAPEYGRCVKAEQNAKKEYNGSYSDSKCTKAVTEAEKAKKGKYDMAPGAGKEKVHKHGRRRAAGNSRWRDGGMQNRVEHRRIQAGSNKEEAGSGSHVHRMQSRRRLRARARVRRRANWSQTNSKRP